MLLLTKQFYFNKNNKFIKLLKIKKINNLNLIGQILFIRYFFFKKKKRKLFKLVGLCIDYKPNTFLTIRIITDKEPLKIIFCIFNPYVINLEFIHKYPNIYRIKRWFFKEKFNFNQIFNLNYNVYNFNYFETYIIKYLINNICSKFKLLKFNFLFKTRHKFR